MGRKNYLSTPTKARKYLNKLLNELGECDPAAAMTWYRARVYTCKAILEAISVEKSQEIEVRLEKIEQLLAEHQQGVD
jgi:Glu-tRNA(Gln) amidotransferase subunit E-like FAD-binding protein